MNDCIILHNFIIEDESNEENLKPKSSKGKTYSIQKKTII
jgi:hypothetical protein